MTGNFLNVDLDIESSKPLGALLREFEALGAIILHSGTNPSGHILRIEAEMVRRTKPDQTVVAVCRLVEQLSPKARKIWDAARSRSFDIGIDAIDEHQAARVSVPEKLVRRIGDLGGTLTVTVYRPLKEGPPATIIARPAKGPKGRR